MNALQGGQPRCWPKGSQRTAAAAAATRHSRAGCQPAPCAHVQSMKAGTGVPPTPALSVPLGWDIGRVTLEGMRIWLKVLDTELTLSLLESL